jgi:hypothetical protein
MLICNCSSRSRRRCVVVVSVVVAGVFGRVNMIFMWLWKATPNCDERNEKMMQISKCTLPSSRFSDSIDEMWEFIASAFLLAALQMKEVMMIQIVHAV